MMRNNNSTSVPGTIKAIVNGQEFRIAEEGSRLLINDVPRDFYFHPLPDGRFYIREGARGMHARITDRSADGKTLTVSAEGRLLVVQLRDRLDDLMGRMNMHSTGKSSAGRLLAPMPGLIKSVLVTEGQTAPAGEAALVLEAMKMENLIRTPAESTIRKILVSPGDRVEKGQLLIEFN